jgi:GNAT superfamily N-acetyltransferase
VSEPRVVPATPAHRDRVVETVVAAFAADPAFRYFFPDDATYPALAGRFTRSLFDRRLPLGGAWIVDGGSAVSMWDPPAAPSGAVAESPELHLPHDVQARLDTWDTTVHHLLPTDPHWYLGVLATDPAHAGKRWGRAVMAAGLERATTAGLPAYLETATQQNVEVYQRSGWTVTGTAEVGPVTACVMRHPGGAR